MQLSYAFSECPGKPHEIIVGKTSRANEIKAFLDKLTKPKSHVCISLPDSTGFGSVDLWRLEDENIEMEIMQDCNDDFAVIDIPTAKRVVDVLFHFQRNRLIRDMLQELPIVWICG